MNSPLETSVCRTEGDIGGARLHLIAQRNARVNQVLSGWPAKRSSVVKEHLKSPTKDALQSRHESELDQEVDAKHNEAPSQQPVRVGATDEGIGGAALSRQYAKDAEQGGHAVHTYSTAAAAAVKDQANASSEVGSDETQHGVLVEGKSAHALVDVLGEREEDKTNDKKDKKDKKEKNPGPPI